MFYLSGRDTSDRPGQMCLAFGRVQGQVTISHVASQPFFVQFDEVTRLKFACLLYLSKKVRTKDPASEQTKWGLPEILKYFDLR